MSEQTKNQKPASEEKLEDGQASAPTQEAIIEALKAENAELKKQLSALAESDETPANRPPAVPNRTFKVAGKKYRFRLAKFIVPGIGKLTAEEALTDKDILEKLVEMNSGSIKRDF